MSDLTEGQRGVFAPGEEVDNGRLIEANETPEMKTVSAKTYVPSRLSFPLRGNSLNRIVDASQPLLALLARIPDVRNFDSIDHLHHDISAEIESIELELHREGYDRATILAHRYCLCTAVDEAVMCSPWGQDSDWSERSLLAQYHSETWGGEKFFIVLARLMRDPERYIELIEFLYLLLCLGFEGKYRVMHNGRSQLETVIREVHDAIRKERGDPPEVLTSFRDKVIRKAHIIRRQTPVSLIWILFAILCIGTFAAFYISLGRYTDQVIQQLQNIL